MRVVEQELRQKNNSASSGGGKVTTFYSFLMSLSKNEAVNGEIGENFNPKLVSLAATVQSEIPRISLAAASYFILSKTHEHTVTF